MSEENVSLKFLAGGGEMGALMRAHDWSGSSLGAPVWWPQALRTVVRLMLNTGHPMYIWWGADGACLYNDAYSQSIGPERHPSSLGQPARAVWEEIWPIIGSQIEQVMSGGGATWHEDALVPITRHGRREDVYWTYSYSPIDDDTAPNGIGGVLVTCSETTKQVLAARQLSITSGRFWQITPDLLGVLNGDGYFETVNPAWEAILGWTEAEVQAMSIFELLHPDDRETTRGGFEYLKEGNPILRFENRYRRKDGGYSWFAWSAAPLGGAYYCAGRDITVEKQQADELATSQAERDRVWLNSRDLLTVASSDGIFRAANPAWKSILGYDPDEVIGHSFREFVVPDDAERTHDGLKLTIASDELTNFENRYRHKDGTLRWISWRTAQENGLAYAFGRDITAEKEAEAELARAQESLRQSQKMEAVGQLTGGIAHDFNNLLAGISGSLELIDKRIAQNRIGDTQRFIGIAQSAARRAAALTQRLLAFSRRQTLDPRPTDMNRLIAGMVDLIERTIGPDVQLEVAATDGLWSTRVDPSQLENALLNLCINARDAMAPGGGRLTIEAANTALEGRPAAAAELPPGDYVSIRVGDTGAGMEPHVIARAFDPFFTTKPLGEGTGLGLSMVYGFVRQSGGQVHIHSQIGKGTVIHLYLPRHLGEADGVEPTEAMPVPEGSTGETVLVIDDESSIRLTIVDVLEEAGYIAIQASDGPAGLKILQSDTRIDLLITDVGLPGGMNGRQVADAARTTRPGLKVLFITGYAEQAAIGADKLAAGMEIMTKPFAIGALAGKIREMIER